MPRLRKKHVPAPSSRHCRDMLTIVTAYKDWSEQLIVRHAHSRWEIQRGTLKSQEVRANTCRGCPRRRMRTPPDANYKQLEMGCAWCWECKFARLDSLECNFWLTRFSRAPQSYAIVRGFRCPTVDNAASCAVQIAKIRPTIPIAWSISTSSTAQPRRTSGRRVLLASRMIAPAISAGRTS